jgi:beta-glucosidase
MKPTHSLIIALLLTPLTSLYAAEIAPTPPLQLPEPVRTVYSDAERSAEERAQAVVGQMTMAEKKTLVKGYNEFFIAPLDRFGLRAVYLTDASAGMNIRPKLFVMDKSIAYPATVALAATWEPELAERYGASIGGECRAWGADVLLGPGVNIYRNSQNGRNFEYMGEDPFLVGMMASGHVRGVQSRGIMATAKHFLCNNHEWLRMFSDIHVDDRALRELYARSWYRIIHSAGVGAVMTSYNLLNGEKASQSKELIAGLLREEIGFEGLVMSDWGAVWDRKKVVFSGQDLVMPRGDVQYEPGQENEFNRHLDRMVTSILTACFRYGYYDRAAKDESFMKEYPEYEATALNTARRSITLLKNQEGLLPLVPEKIKKIVVTGPGAQKTPHAGQGSGGVKGYDHKHILAELTSLLGAEKVLYSKKPTAEELAGADAAIVCVLTVDGENNDRPFALPSQQEELIALVAGMTSRTIVVVNSGGGVRMTGWRDKVGGILHAYYAGQYGGTAIAEILTGKVNPSGRLPFTIEREFADSPAATYKPQGAGFSNKRDTEVEKNLPKCPIIEYSEGIFVGYRWYDHKKIEPLFPFGHGLSYTTFDYSDLNIAADEKGISVSVTVRNSGSVAGAEVVQVYFHDPKSSVERPLKELCGFQKIDLKAGESKKVSIFIHPQDLAFYNVAAKNWKTEAGDYKILIGSSSRDIRLQGACRWEKDAFFKYPVPNILGK